MRPIDATLPFSIGLPIGRGNADSAFYTKVEQRLRASIARLFTVPPPLTIIVRAFDAMPGETQGVTMDAIAVVNRILETFLRAFEAERGEVLSKADKNLMKLMKHAFDAGAYTMLQAVSTF